MNRNKVTNNDCVCYHWFPYTFKNNFKMTNEPYALRLADRLNAWPDAEELDDAAAELRRLHALNAQLTQVSKELLEALTWIDRRCPAAFLLQDLHKVHMEAAFDAGVCARAAISRAESTLKTE